MHPAASVIVFTTLSGAGFGMLAWLGIDSTPSTGWGAFGYYFVAFALAVGGLLSSTFHLGHPERAMKAFTQWRTSWLSREGVCAVLALTVMGLYAAGLIFLGEALSILGWIGAILSLGTVYTTSMIYAQLATIPRWNTPLTSLLYLTFAIAGGALLTGKVTIALVLLVAASFVQVIWWKKGDTAFADRGTNLGTATGLGDRGEVRSLAHPHTSPNYLMREFIYTVGRKHVQKLRVISLTLMAAVPVVLLALFGANHFIALIAVLSHIAGVATSRWLFFAEAEHTVGIYYGMR
ncbi:dimethyl sulfoxide reductase anchor subunit family protein [Cognatishimia maritima]|uniref:DMSO reductase anchor subunit n=1 Tax=Cognatishimia maritima TaxID=870908 RepID=A0A1M5N2A8_9RHOB|nr:DmsC/YnfH family molybdoenzyme membrane anchor subunit [Cognatishimia maritima]SHG83552.1 DMSO reductase anchor subunit [Cognatishimia maritima]